MNRNILILFFVGAMISCDKKQNNLSTNIDSYPMAVGTEWTYDRQVIIKKFESETSENIIDIDTLYFTDKVWIDKDTVLSDTVNVKVFKSQEIGSDWTSIEYKYIDSEGLKNFAFSQSGLANSFSKKSTYIKPTFNFNFYRSLNSGALVNEGIVLLDKPTLDIVLPLESNSAWTYRQTSDTRLLQIDKKVSGSETLSLLGQNFFCCKVSWNYLNDPVFDGIEMIDWISEKGLIKRSTLHDRITFTNENGESLFTAQSTETLILKTIKIK